MIGIHGFVALWLVSGTPAWNSDQTAANRIVAAIDRSFREGWATAATNACRDFSSSPSALHALPKDVPGLIRKLDDDSFEVRQTAALRLERLSRDPECAASMAECFEDVLCAEQTSAEVRNQLAEILSNLPPASPLQLSSAEIDDLLMRLDVDSFAARSAAGAQLARLERNPAMYRSLLEGIKAQLADPNLPKTSRQQFEELWQAVHGEWLLSDSKHWNLPVVPAATMCRWIDKLVKERPQEFHGDWLPHRTATRELLDLIVRPDTCEAATKAIEDRLVAKNLGIAARTRLTAILEWTRPGVAIEIWSERHLSLTEFCPVPIPNALQRKNGSNDFDRVNDLQLHCETDEILDPGDYPVGEAMSGSNSDEFWCLVNLPTAQRRLAYDYELHFRTDARRLEEITVQTLHRRLDHNAALDGCNEHLLDLLDHDAISRLADSFLMQMNDASPDSSKTSHSNPLGSPSRHGKFCLWLADHGTREAIPGLVHANDSERVFKPDHDCPVNLPWLAALILANRDPWQGEDAWLAAQIARTEKLDINCSADVGATAAAMLLRRNRELPRDFGVEEVDSEALGSLQFRAYHFSTPARRNAVERWWSLKSAECSKNN
jgi:hypothetical protein